MAHVEEFHLEGADLGGFARLHRVQIRFGQGAVARQLHFQQPAGEGRGVDGGLNLGQHMVQRADVILVAVGDDDPAHLIAAAEHIIKIGDDVIHAQHIAVGEHQAGIHNQDLALIFIHHHIFTNFPQSTQGHNANCLFIHTCKTSFL